MNTASRSIGFLLVHVTVLLVSADTLTARADSYPTVAYRLVEGSTYQEGCFDPCDCPILEEQVMTGTFDLVFYPFAGPLWTVGVENVAWSVPTLGKEINGQGIYRRAGNLQLLRLDLEIDGELPRTFDSGWVAGGASYPVIDVMLSMNGLFCYDIALHVRAKPTDMPHLDVDDALLSWSSVSGVSTYDVLSGNLTALRANGGDFSTAVDACLADELPGTALTHDAAGDAVWFLVRPHDGSYDSAGEWQVDSRDEEIAASSCACP